MLVPEQAEPAFAPGLGRNESEEAGHKRLDRKRVHDEDQAEERRQNDVRCVDAEELGDEERGADRP